VCVCVLFMCVMNVFAVCVWVREMSVCVCVCVCYACLLCVYVVCVVCLLVCGV